jgi:mono/diheme cytochrome c family protein
MKRWLLWLGCSSVAGLALAFLLWSWLPSSQPTVFNDVVIPPVPKLRAAQLERGATLYATYCAQCHGANLAGTPNWKERLADGSLPPPPHDNSGHTWHHSDKVLLEIIRDGGNPASNSTMPAFGDKLSDEDMKAILDFFKSTWGKKEREYQWGITATSSEP